MYSPRDSISINPKFFRSLIAGGVMVVGDGDNHPNKAGWVMTKEIRVYSANGAWLLATVPVGFVSDGASIPWYVRWAVPPAWKTLVMSFVHDFGYRDPDARRMGRKYWDMPFEAIAKKQGMEWRYRRRMYRALRALGWIAWYSNGLRNLRRSR